MALVKKTEFNGISLEKGYYKVRGIQIFNQEKTAKIDVAFYANQEARSADPLNVISSTEYTCYHTNPSGETGFDDFFSVTKMNGSGQNPYVSAYNFLKTIPEFSEASDLI